MRLPPFSSAVEAKATPPHFLALKVPSAPKCSSMGEMTPCDARCSQVRTLASTVLDWFSELLNGTITDFEGFAKLFAVQFMANKMKLA
ncbi:hypothetical protein CR513_45850, partial [Mucuna pruriens]